MILKGLEITNDGIVFPLDNSGRQTGEAYVKFANASSGEKALAKHKEKIAHRSVPAGKVIIIMNSSFVNQVY